MNLRCTSNSSAGVATPRVFKLKLLVLSRITCFRVYKFHIKGLNHLIIGDFTESIGICSTVRINWNSALVAHQLEFDLWCASIGIHSMVRINWNSLYGAHQLGL